MLFQSFRTDRIRELFKHSSWLLFSNGWTLGITTVQGFLIAHLLGVRDYGLIALVTTYVTVVNQLIDFRINEMATKYLSKFWVNNDKDRVVSTLKLCYLIDFSTGVIAFLLIVFTAHLASTFILHNAGLGIFIKLYALRLLFCTVDGTSVSFLTVSNRFSWLSLHSIISSTLQIVIIFVSLKLHYGITGILVSYVVINVLGSTAFLLLAAKTFFSENLVPHMHAKLSLIKDHSKELRRFMLSTYFYESFSLFTKNVDILLLGYFRSPSEAGYYRLAKSFVSILSIIVDPFYRVFYPQLSKLWSSNKISEFKQLIVQFSYFMAVFLIPSTVCAFFAIPWIIKITVGAQYVPSVLAVRIMLWGPLIGAILFWVRPAILAIGKPKILTYTSAFLAATMFLLGIVIVPRFGYLGSCFLHLYFYVVLHLVALVAFVRLTAKKSYGAKPAEDFL